MQDRNFGREEEDLAFKLTDRYKYHQLITASGAALKLYMFRGVHLQDLRVEGVPWMPPLHHPPVREAVSVVKFWAGGRDLASPPWRLRPMNRCRARERVERRGNGLSAEHPGSSFELGRGKKKENKRENEEGPA